MPGINGKAVTTYKKSNVGKNWPAAVLPKSDEFNQYKLGLQWAWNHNPNDSLWSLTERKGFLRLKTGKVVDNLKFARNTLTQRHFGPASTGTAEFDVSRLKDGDVAGLAIFQDPYAYIAVQQKNGKKRLFMIDNGKEVAAIETLSTSKIYLQAKVDAITDDATFFYSTDDISFKQLGNSFAMKFNLSVFTGNKFCLFNYATQNSGGYADINWFRMQVAATK